MTCAVIWDEKDGLAGPVSVEMQSEPKSEVWMTERKLARASRVAPSSPDSQASLRLLTANHPKNTTRSICNRIPAWIPRLGKPKLKTHKHWACGAFSMATQWFAHDDAMSVDEDEAQAPAGQ